MKTFKTIIVGLICAFTMLNVTGCIQKQVVDGKVTLYITRHGETLFNEQGRAQGWCDSPLTEKGEEDAERLGNGLKDIEFSNAYTSTSERAVDTANLILKDRNIPLHQDKNLKEMNFGNLEGESGEKLWSKGIDYRFEEGWKEEGGEDFYLLGERSRKVLDEIVENKENQGKNVLISTHGMTILGMLYTIDPVQADAIDGGIENCSITKIVYENGEYTIEEVNDTSYMK